MATPIHYAYAVSKLPDGGYVVFQSDGSISFERVPMFAHHQISQALEYIRDKMEQRDVAPNL